jgi:ATP-dependent Clp protease ATP-binding subunit ClpA
VPKDEKHGYAELMNHNLEWSKQGSDAPLSVVLLDEWDKACFEFNQLLLQAMDDGQITLGLRRSR